MPSFKAYPFAFIHGKIVPIEQAQISIMTNALHYGGGIFGGIKAYETTSGIGVFRLQDHIKRLAESAKILRFPYAFNQQKIAEQICALAHKNKLSAKTYIRPLLYRSDIELSPDIAGEYDLAIYMLDMTNDYISGANGLSVGVSPWVRNSDNALPPRTKATGGYLNSALAIYDAHQAGFDSAIMLNQRGDVCEGAVMNLFLVKNGTLITPPVDADILEGITRRTIMELAAEHNIPCIERSVDRSELYAADELFFTGTAVEVSWVRAVDNVIVSGKIGPITTKLTELFKLLPATHPQFFTLI